MKKLILLLLITTMVSCGYDTMNNSNEFLIITEIGTSIKRNQNECYYLGKGVSTAAISDIFSENRFCFYDTCGKFQIGDTINLVKR